MYFQKSHLPSSSGKSAPDPYAVSLHQLWFQPGPCQLTTSDSSKPNSGRQGAHSFAVPGDRSPHVCWVLCDIPRGKENQFILLPKALETVTASPSTGWPLDSQKTMASRTQNSTTEPVIFPGWCLSATQIRLKLEEHIVFCKLPVISRLDLIFQNGVRTMS